MLPGVRGNMEHIIRRTTLNGHQMLTNSLPWRISRCRAGLCPKVRTTFCMAMHYEGSPFVSFCLTESSLFSFGQALSKLPRDALCYTYTRRAQQTLGALCTSANCASLLRCRCSTRPGKLSGEGNVAHFRSRFCKKQVLFGELSDHLSGHSLRRLQQSYALYRCGVCARSPERPCTEQEQDMPVQLQPVVVITMQDVAEGYHAIKKSRFGVRVSCSEPVSLSGNNNLQADDNNAAAMARRKLAPGRWPATLRLRDAASSLTSPDIACGRPYYIKDRDSSSVTVSSERYVCMLTELVFPDLCSYDIDLDTDYFQQEGATMHTSKVYATHPAGINALKQHIVDEVTDIPIAALAHVIDNCESHL
ncbi:hypothetical protein PR048_002969 [Dryococelus australis]|uniref:Uncharacterized protein n=1 Tax=Dryococelus australis TaxID=614101 RepID=A0ABQ9ILN9_9NEOP|nr:hypothetical protein PR048_002969 [Dryococelus australis]